MADERRPFNGRDTTVIFNAEETNELCNLLQLMTVMHVRLYMGGNCHPKHEHLATAFTKLSIAAITGGSK